MIQAVITRMSGNLFLLKGWTVTLIVALFTIIAKDPRGTYVLFSFIVLFIFWLLDGYFLSVERCFRDLYDDVRMKNNKEIDFSMDFSNYMTRKRTWLRSMFSKTLLTFYGILFVLMVIVVITANISNFKLNLIIDWDNQKCTTINNNQ